MDRRSFLKMIPALGAAAVVPVVIASPEESPPVDIEILTDENGKVFVRPIEMNGFSVVTGERAEEHIRSEARRINRDQAIAFYGIS